MKKIILSLSIIVGLFFVLVASSVYLTDFNKIYTNFITSAKIEPTSINNKVSYKIKKFPLPLLTIDEVKQKGKIELKNIEIRFSLLSFLKFDPRISDLTIAEMIVHLSHDDVTLLHHDELISELIDEEALNISANIKKLLFIESDDDIPLIIENFVFSGSSSGSKFKGDVNSVGSLKGEFTKNLNFVNFNIDFIGSGYNFKLQEIYENSLLQSGKIEFTTSHLTEKLTMLAADFGSLFDKLDASEQVKISSDITASSNWLNLKNIVIDSKSLQATGEMAISKTPQDISDIKINFSKIDLNNWVKTKNSNEKNTKNFLGTNNKFDFSKNQMKAIIFAKLIQLDDVNALTDVTLKSSIQNGQLNIEDFSGMIEPVSTLENDASQAGGFKLSGVISQNSFRSLFVGKIDLTHNDLNDLAEMIGGKEARSENKIPYTLLSDIKFSSVDLSFQNLLVKTPDTEVSGNISTKFIANSPRTNAILKFSKINLDKKDFPILNQIYNDGLNLIQGSKQEDYLSKFIPVRLINALSNYDLSFDQVILNNAYYKNVSLNIALAPGKIRLEHLSLSDGKNYIDMSVDLLASGINPSFNVVIHNGSLETAFLSPIALSELRKKILENFALDKIDLTMNFAINKLYEGPFELGRVIFKAKNNKSLFEINNFEADMFGGRMVSSGSILLEPYTFNFVYSLSSASISDISKLMPPRMLDNGGVISANGMWSTNGDTREEQLYNLYTKSNIIIKDIKINNFSIDSMIQTANDPNYNTENFSTDMKRALLTGKTEVSDLKASVELIKGIFQVKQVSFKTKYTSGTAAIELNLYDLNMNLSSIFSFYLAKPTYGASYSDYSPITMPVTANGNLFTPKKEADTKAFEEALNARKKK